MSLKQILLQSITTVLRGGTHPPPQNNVHCTFGNVKTTQNDHFWRAQPFCIDLTPPPLYIKTGLWWNIYICCTIFTFFVILSLNKQLRWTRRWHLLMILTGHFELQQRSESGPRDDKKECTRGRGGPPPLVQTNVQEDGATPTNVQKQVCTIGRPPPLYNY